MSPLLAFVKTLSKGRLLLHVSEARGVEAICTARNLLDHERPPEALGRGPGVESVWLQNCRVCVLPLSTMPSAVSLSFIRPSRAERVRSLVRLRRERPRGGHCESLRTRPGITQRVCRSEVTLRYAFFPPCITDWAYSGL